MYMYSNENIPSYKYLRKDSVRELVGLLATPTFPLEETCIDRERF